MSDATMNRYWIWPRSSTVREDGSIVFKTSGWDRGEIQWSGQETIAPTSDAFPSFRWIHDNRQVLPPLIQKQNIPDRLEYSPPPPPPRDGIYFLGDASLVSDWVDQFTPPLVNIDATQEPTMQLFALLSGANCFVFLNGHCEAAISIAAEPSECCVSPNQAAGFIRSSIAEATK